MQRKFSAKLILFMTIGMILIVSSIFIIQHVTCKQNNIESGNSTLVQVIQKLESNDASLEELEKTHNENALAKTRAFAEMVRLNPEIIEDTKMMQKIADLLDVDEVHVTDENGVLLWGNIPDFYGFDFASGDQTKPFLDILKDSSIELAQEPQENATTGRLFQYTGVTRTDKKGIVQIGLSPDVLNNTLANNAIEKVLADYSLEDNKYLFAINEADGKILAHENASLIGTPFTKAGFSEEVLNHTSKSYKSVVDGKKVLYVTTNYDGMIVGIATPENVVFAQRNNQTLVFLAGLFVVFVLLIIIINFILKKDIINGITKIIEDLQKITSGDLNVTASVRSNKEFSILSDSINNMVISIKNGYEQNAQHLENNNVLLKEQEDLFENIKNISAEIREFSNETATISYKISNSSREQSECVSNVNQTMEELSRQSKENEQITLRVSHNVYQSSERVENAKSSMDEMKAAMSEIAATSEEIKSIIANIDKISAQTNMLALNASIEAARAGEAGRGFAVVATQVSELAAQSAKAASETNELIQNSLEAIEKGNFITEKTSSEFQIIIDETRNVGEAVTELVNSFELQIETIDKATTGVNHVNELANQNVEIVSESERVSQRLEDQVEILNSVMNNA